MLSKILSKKECAKCRICCCFDSSDVWETPIITKPLHDKILGEYNPKQKFIKKDNCYILDMPKDESDDLYYCSMLDRNSGCILKDDKPFDCKIWPFRVMDFNGVNVITLSPVCPVVKTRSLEDLSSFIETIAPTIFQQANDQPEIIKPYIKGYPILATDC